MQSPLSRYVVLVKRWFWVVLAGMALCCGATYGVSKLLPPVYQASALLVVNLDATSSSNTTSSLAAVPTYAQLVTNPTVLESVVALHPGMTLAQLNAKLTVKPQSNTQLIEVAVQDQDPHVATQIANEVSQSFVRYANAQLPGTVQILQAQQPSEPLKPKPVVNTEIAALVSLALSITLIIIFEWIDDHPNSVDEIRRLLDTRLLTVLPLFASKGRRSSTHKKVMGSQEGLVLDAPLLAEKYHMLCAGLNSALPSDACKVLLITSALAAEGKSTVAAQLAIFLAQSGKKVLLVDANLHRPAQANRFHLKGTKGLSQILIRSASVSPSDLFGAPTEIANLHLLPAGYTPSRPAELFQSPHARTLFEHFKHASFEYVLIDAPPLLPVADAQIIASCVHAVVVVVNAHKISRRALIRAREELSKAHATLLGVVVNKSRWPDYTRELEYPDDPQQPQEGDTASLPAPLPTVAVQTPQISARQQSGALWDATEGTSMRVEGQS